MLLHSWFWANSSHSPCWSSNESLVGRRLTHLIFGLVFFIFIYLVGEISITLGEKCRIDFHWLSRVPIFLLIKVHNIFYLLCIKWSTAFWIKCVFSNLSLCLHLLEYQSLFNNDRLYLSVSTSISISISDEYSSSVSHCGAF